MVAITNEVGIFRIIVTRILKRSKVIAVASACLCISSVTLHGFILFDNIVNEDPRATLVNSSNTFLAQQFSTVDAVTLTSLTLPLSEPNAAGSFSIDIYDHDPTALNQVGQTIGAPGSSIATIFSGSGSSAGLTTSLSNISFGSLSVTLDAEKLYWVVLQGNTDSYTWGITADLSGSGDGFQLQRNFFPATSTVPLWSSTLTTPQRMTLTAEVVPEPSTYALFVLGLTSIVICHRRRQCKAAYLARF